MLRRKRGELARESVIMQQDHDKAWGQQRDRAGERVLVQQ